MKIRVVKLILIILCCLFLSPDTSKTSAEKNLKRERSVWMWNPWLLLDENKNPFEFLESKQINKVYLQIDVEISKSTYQNFIEEAKKKDIQVVALAGEEHWITENGSYHLEQFLNWVGQYQEESTDAQQFLGIHLDIEPYTTTLWETNRMLAIQTFQELVIQAKMKAKEFGVLLELDIAFWYDEVKYNTKYGSGILSNWTIENSDSVTIMAYRDYSDEIIEGVKNEIAYANRMKKKVVIGVETMESAEGNRVSFFEEGEKYMNKQLKHVQRYYSLNPSFNGIAIHHFESWSEMKP